MILFVDILGQGRITCESDHCKGIFSGTQVSYKLLHGSDGIWHFSCLM